MAFFGMTFPRLVPCTSSRGAAAVTSTDWSTRANRQGHIHVGDGGYVHSHAGCLGFPEPGLFRGDRVVAGGQVEDVIDPVSAGFHGLRQTRC